MKRMKLCNYHLDVHPAVYILFPVLVLLMPIRWLAAIIISCLVHELCHYVPLRLMGVPIYAVRISLFGIHMQTAYMAHWQELLCALAGPVGGVVLAVVCKKYPCIALCSLVHSVFNLLPVHPSDGSRALRSFLQLILPDTIAFWVHRSVEYLCLAGVVWISIYITFVAHLGAAPLIIGIYIMIRKSNEKILANRQHKEYNDAIIR